MNHVITFWPTADHICNSGPSVVDRGDVTDTLGYVGKNGSMGHEQWIVSYSGRGHASSVTLLAGIT